MPATDGALETDDTPYEHDGGQRDQRAWDVEPVHGNQTLDAATDMVRPRLGGNSRGRERLVLSGGERQTPVARPEGSDLVPMLDPASAIRNRRRAVARGFLTRWPDFGRAAGCHVPLDTATLIDYQYIDSQYVDNR
ncbi:hypothetical protein GCM10009810_20270 [Nostocoides vanveenii]|uniref:Uncharacterized protein n=1 Tax=Nostocoides vanveenii TaxID=330835 RepID=A0ABN2KMY5_9MICO